MTRSLTKDWEYKVYDLVEYIQLQIIIKHPLDENDNGEQSSALEEFLIDLFREIEDCSSFEAEKQLGEVIRNLMKEITNRRL